MWLCFCGRVLDENFHVFKIRTWAGNDKCPSNYFLVLALKIKLTKYFSIQCSPIYEQLCFLNIPRLRPFVLLIRAIRGWRWVRSACVTVLTGEKRSTCSNPCRNVTLSTTNPTPTRRLTIVWTMTRSGESQRAAPCLASHTADIITFCCDALHRLLQPASDGSSNRRTNSATNCNVFGSVSKKNISPHTDSRTPSECPSACS
jgi:hypothetical protein